MKIQVLLKYYLPTQDLHLRQQLIHQILLHRHRQLLQH
jgi:hypothetical protein